MSSRYQAGIVLPGYNALKVANAPTIGTATAGNAQASVTFTAPSCVGGGAISSYTAYCTTTGTNIASGASSPLVVTGLTNGTAYTFKVVATNAYGPSYQSAASNSVTPAIPLVSAVDYLVVAGGGGGAANSGGGGGAGGMRSGTSFSIGASFTVTVGAGGAKSNSTVADSGSDSVFSSITSLGGGGGSGSPVANGGSGGSGGGGNYYTNGGTGTSGQGNNGGNGTGGNYPFTGGGGGGKGASGQTAGGSAGGNGGAGSASSISGSSVTYAGGGGGTGGPFTGGNGGSGGGGAGGNNSTNGTNGTANLGGGGGASSAGGSAAGNGGSGVVIIAYPSSYPDFTSIGVGLTYTKTTSGGNTIYTFTAGTGTVTV